MLTLEHETWLQDESVAYTPRGSERRKGAAIYPDGVTRRVYAGIPDTFFSIPAHGRMQGRYVSGWLTVDDRLFTCPRCEGTNWQHCTLCSFGLVDSPTRGALIFHLSQQSQR